jgi:hypothetical protein
MDILRLWDIGASIGEVYVYEGIYGFLRGRLTVAGRRGQLYWNGPLLVVMRSPFIPVQGGLVLGIELVYETEYMVSRGRDDICITPLVNDPTPIRKMSEDREIDATDARQVTSHAVLQSQRICSL